MDFIVFVFALCLIILYILHRQRVKVLSEKLLAETLKANTARETALADAALLIKRKEAELRKDAVRRSQSVTRGKVAEQIAPYLPDFKYNPRDCRFLGSPVDLVVFDGLTEGLLRQVVFIEVKSGKHARLTYRETQVKEILELKGARYEIVRSS